MTKAQKLFLLAFVVVVVDQAVKLAVKLNMNLRQGIEVIGSFFQIYFIENDGAAFGTTIDGILNTVGVPITPETGKFILSIFSIVAVSGIGYALWRMRDHASPLPWFLGLIFGGAIGNIIDRTFYGVLFHKTNVYDGTWLRGQVVDMFYFDIYKGPYPTWLHWLPGVDEFSYLFVFPVFNVADAALSVGIVVILIFQGKFFRMDAKAKEAAAPAPVAATTETVAAATKVITETQPAENQEIAADIASSEPTPEASTDETTA
jgi:signal peptidase II